MTSPIQVPVTGGETSGAISNGQKALVEFYRAFNHRDLIAMEQNWLCTDEVVMNNPLGGVRRGWPAIRDTYARIFHGPATVYVEFYDYTLHETPEMLYAVGRERGFFHLEDTRIELAIRTSRIFREHAGRWRQVHHHGSIEDPALLDRYQRAVMGRSG